MRCYGLAYERDGRLDLLPPVRDYARRHKEPIGEDARRWREYYIDLACTKCDLLGSRSGASAATRLRSEVPNIEAAVNANIKDLGIRSAKDGIDALCRMLIWAGIGTPRRLYKWTRNLAEAYAADRAYAEAGEFLLWLGELSLSQENYADAVGAYEEARNSFEKTEAAAKAIGRCTLGLGNVARARSDYHLARELYEQACSKSSPEQSDQALCFERLGELEISCSNHDTAAHHYQRALKIYQSIYDKNGEAIALQG